MILIQEHKIVEYKSFDVNRTFAVILVDNPVELFYELYFSNAELRDDLEEVTESCDPFFLTFAEFRVEGKANSVLLLVLHLVPEVVDYYFQQILCH